MSKKITAYISKNIIEKIEKGKIEIKKAMTSIDNVDIGKRERIDFLIDENKYKKIKEIKEKTKQPMWSIIEKIFNYYLINKRFESQDNIEKEHIEPDSCPECGASDDELLIQHSDYSWYCHSCQASGNY